MMVLQPKQHPRALPQHPCASVSPLCLPARGIPQVPPGTGMQGHPLKHPQVTAWGSLELQEQGKGESGESHSMIPALLHTRLIDPGNSRARMSSGGWFSPAPPDPFCADTSGMQGRASPNPGQIPAPAGRAWPPRRGREVMAGAGGNTSIPAAGTLQGWKFTLC